MRNHSRRLARVEAAAAERRQAGLDAALDALNTWLLADWTATELDLWERWLLNQPMPDAQRTQAAGSLEVAQSILDERPPLTPDEDAVVSAAWLRVPEDLKLRVESTL